jgi:hypothetical protein
VGASSQKSDCSGIEAAAEAAEIEWLAHLIPYAEAADLGIDIAKGWWEYNEFMNKLNEAKQGRCECIGS